MRNGSLRREDDMPRSRKRYAPVLLLPKAHLRRRRRPDSAAGFRFDGTALLALTYLLLSLASALPCRADLLLTLRWAPPIELTSVALETPDGETKAATKTLPGTALFPPLTLDGRYALVYEVDGESHRSPFDVPSSGHLNLDLQHDSVAGPKLSVEIRPMLSGEINVTARKRQETALGVPISMIVRDEGQLEASSTHDLSQLDNVVSNLDVSLSGGAGGAPAEATIYLRGVGQIEPGVFADPGVGIYLDGMYIARSQGAVFDFLDVERVEILRGPQGTLFGKNSTGGAINLITRRPRAQSHGRLGLTAGSLDRLELLTGLEGKLGPKLNGSLSLRRAQRDGYTSSLISGQDFSDEDNWSARGALSWQTSTATRFDVSVRGVQEREAALDQGLLSIPGAPLLSFYQTALAAVGEPIIDQRFINGDLYTSFADYPSYNRGDIFSTVARLSHRMASLELLSISGYRQYEYSGSSDFDGTPIPFFARSYVQEQDQLSQELQLTGQAFDHRLQFLLGGLYFDEHPMDDSVTDNLGGLFDALERAPGAIYSPPGAPPEACPAGPTPGTVPCFGGAGNPNNGAFFFGDGIVDRLDIETRSWALFGEASLALGDRLSLTTGLRYTEETKDVQFFTSPKNSPDRTLRDGDGWQAVSPRLALSYAFNDDVTVYASASHGFKSGGFNAGRSLSRAALNPFDQETLWAYESGFKGIFIDNRLQLTGALFHYDYDDIQFASFLTVDNDFFYVIQNAASAKIQGFEIDLEARPSDTLSLNFGVGHVDSEYTELRQQGGASLNGVVPKTPRWTTNASLQYILDLQSKGSWVAHLDGVYKSKHYNDVANSEAIAQGAYALLNARLMYAPLGDRWEFALFGTNLGDEAYFDHGFAALSAGLATGIAGRPREWGVSVLRRF